MGESMNRCAWVQKMVSLMRMGSEYTCHQCLENICNDPAFEITVNQCVRYKKKCRCIHVCYHVCFPSRLEFRKQITL